MMASMPAGLTASTGMDALTHAIEGYTTKGAWEMSDMFHLKAIELISKNLRGAVAGQPQPEGREGMALGQYVAGMGFSNVGLGIVHAMAHTLAAVLRHPARRRLRHACCPSPWSTTSRSAPASATGQGRQRHAASGIDGHEHRRGPPTPPSPPSSSFPPT